MLFVLQLALPSHAATFSFFHFLLSFSFPGTKDYDALRAPNVLATAELLRLAGNGKVKPFVFVSTISAAGQMESDLLSPENAINAGPCMRSHNKNNKKKTS